MAAGNDAERTERPTPRRLEEAAERGQVALSRKLTAAAGLVAATAVLDNAGGDLFDRTRALLAQGLDVARVHAAGIDDPASAARHVLDAALLVATPCALLALAVLAGTAGSAVLQVGLRLRPQALRLDTGRFDPVRNLARMFSWGSAVRTALALLEVTVISGVVWAVLGSRLDTLAALGRSELEQAAGATADLTFRLLWYVTALIATLAVLDFSWQRFDHHRGLRMTRQEVEEERKRSEGDPLIKSRQRRAALDLGRQRMLEAVRKADVVVTNPTHFAVALEYDRRRHAAPVVVAKGADDLARRIRRIAREAGVPTLEDPPLARALWRAVRVGEQIPERFYRAVATVLGHVLKAREGGAS